jgi:hypothetical protein
MEVMLPKAECNILSSLVQVQPTTDDACSLRPKTPAIIAIKKIKPLLVKRFANLNQKSLLFLWASSGIIEDAANGIFPELTVNTSQKVNGLINKLENEAVRVSKIKTPGLIVALACNKSLFHLCYAFKLNNDKMT